MPRNLNLNRQKLVKAREIKRSPAYKFSKVVRTFFEENKLGTVEATYFQQCLKQFKREDIAMAKLEHFIQLPIEERKEIISNKGELIRSMSFRLGE